MAGTRSIQTCRWGAPTLFLPWPFWCRASDHDWSCTRGFEPRGIDDPGACATCSNWAVAQMPAPGRRDEDDHLGSTAS